MPDPEDEKALFRSSGGLCNHFGASVYRLLPMIVHIPSRPNKRTRTEMEMVMDNFQRLLESPFRCLADLGGHLFQDVKRVLSRRRQQALRRRYMNG